MITPDQEQKFAEQQADEIVFQWMLRASMPKLKKLINRLSIEGIYASFGVTPDEESNEAAE